MKKRGGVKYFYVFYHSRACEAIQSLQVIHFVPVILSFAKNPEFPQCYFPVLFIIEKYQKLLLSCLLVLHSVLDLFLEIRKLLPMVVKQFRISIKTSSTEISKLTKIKKQNKWKESLFKQSLNQSFFYFLVSFEREKWFVESSLLFCEFGRNLDFNMDIEIAFVSFSIQTREPLFSESENSSRLRSWLDIERFFSNDRNLYHLGISEDCFCWSDFCSIVEVDTVSWKSSLLIWHIKSDIEITVSVLATVSFSAHLDTHTMFDSCGNINGFCDSFFNLLLPMTGATFLDNLLSRSMTSMTWPRLLHDSKYRLYSFSNLACPMTGATFLGSTSLSMTRTTRSWTLELYRTIAPMNSIFEGYFLSDLDIFSDILSSSRSSEPTTKKARENIPKIHIESSSKSPKSSSPMIIHSAKSVIVWFFVCIGEDRVCFIEFFEGGFFFFVSAMAIGMEFHSLFSVGFLYLISARCSLNLKYRIVFELWHSIKKKKT